MTGIQNLQSSAYLSGTQGASKAKSVERSQETGETQEGSRSSAARYDSYTPSQDGLAAMSLMQASEEADTTVDTDVDADTSVDTDVDADTSVDTDVDADTSVDTDVDADTSVDTDVDADTSVDTDVNTDNGVDTDTEVDVDEEVEEEKDDVENLYSSYSDFQLGAMDKANMKISMMTTQFNTLASMLNTMNAGNNSLSNQSWFSDALTFSYAGKYLANASAGVYNNSNVEGSEETTTRDPIEYNNYNLEGYQSPETESSDSEE